MLFQHLSISALLAASASASCLHATSRLARRVTEVGTVEVSKFGYTGLQGPLNWAGLAVENELCATGTTQSPINIDAATAEKAAVTPVVNIANVESAEFENLGTTVETIVNGTTTLGDATFNLKQFHIHTPSEHRINEEYFPLEMHMVHEAADGSGAIAVISVLFQLCAASSSTDLLKTLAGNLGEIATPGSVTTTGALDFTQIVNHIQTTPLFQYTGSLTTPPCAEGLTFLVTERPLPLDVETFNSFKSVIKFNSRFTQNTLGEGNLLARNGGIGAAAAAPVQEAAQQNATVGEEKTGATHEVAQAEKETKHKAVVVEIPASHKAAAEIATSHKIVKVEH